VTYQLHSCLGFEKAGILTVCGPVLLSFWHLGAAAGAELVFLMSNAPPSIPVYDDYHFPSRGRTGGVYNEMHGVPLSPGPSPRERGDVTDVISTDSCISLVIHTNGWS